MAAAIAPVWSKIGADTQRTTSFDSQSSYATPSSRARASWVRSFVGDVTLRGVIAGRLWPRGYRASSASLLSPDSSILPTAVQCAGRRRPTAETIRTGWVLSTLAM